MIQSYQKLLKIESNAELKLKEAKEELQGIRKILYQKKDFIEDRLIAYLKRELNIDYFKFEIMDIADNEADILVKKDSIIFKENIEGKEFINFNAEELIDSRMFDNKDEIIVVDLNSNEILDLGYICGSLNYNFLSYSDEIKNKLTIFVDYIINKKIYKK